MNPLNLIETVLVQKGFLRPVRSRFERHHGIYIFHYYRSLGELCGLMEENGLRAVKKKAFFNLLSRVLYKATRCRGLCEKVDLVCQNVPVVDCMGQYLLVVGEKRNNL